MNESEEIDRRMPGSEKGEAYSREAVVKAFEDLKECRKYEFVANTAEEFMTLINRDYMYEFANEAYCRAHGKGRADFVNHSVKDVWGEKTFEGIIKPYLDGCFAGNTVRYENWFEYAGRGLRCFYVSYYPYYSDGHEVTHAVVVSCDITDLKKTEEALRESEVKYRSIFENAVEGIFQRSPEGRYLSANPALARMLGYNSPEELIGQPAGPTIEGYVNPADRARVLYALEEEGRVTGFEAERFRKDGSIFWAVTNVHVVKDSEEGKVLYHEGTMEDITARVRAREDLDQSLERLKKSLAGTVQAMSLTVETRDPYTAGHQRRVSSLALAIAEEMGLPDDEVNNIRMGGCIHDIGKLAVPSDLLSKPTRLMDIEFNLIKYHAQAGYLILKDAELPYPIAEMVYQHHERLDGKGYPRGLKGEEILKEARILAVADVVEAISSHRPYRPALGIDVALEEIEKNAGVAYDKQVVDVCVRLFREKGFQFE
jgi:PAS domain S-box-containing protein